MDIPRTLHIVKALANGINPHTGETFDPDSPYQHPDTVRALFRAVALIEQQDIPAAANVGEKPQPAAAKPATTGAGSRWTPEEESRLAAAFDEGRTPQELARMHGRSLAGIEARLLKLGKIDAAALTTQLRYPPQRTTPREQPRG